MIHLTRDQNLYILRCGVYNIIYLYMCVCVCIIILYYYYYQLR
jgi:hypothetical protein